MIRSHPNGDKNCFFILVKILLKLLAEILSVSFFKKPQDNTTLRSILGLNTLGMFIIFINKVNENKSERK
jgi:hypothetical protein